jgi:ABC-type transport system involved in multi-copper enzyme maturation permease subunit
MIWFTWRQYRTEALIAIIVLLLITSILLITRMPIASFAHQLGITNTNCATEACNIAYYKLAAYIEGPAFGGVIFYNLFQTILRALPVLLGMFVGVQVIARELEQGTYRLIWTQSIPWSRWLRIKISALLLCFLGGMGLLLGVFLWWKIPAISFSIDTWGYENYEVWSLAAVAYTLFALALGICVGTVLKKTVPAMAVTLVIFVVVRLLIAVYLRPYFLPPVVELVPWSGSGGQSVPAQAFLIKGGETVDRQGNPFDTGNGVCKEPPSSGGSLKPTPSRENMTMSLMNITLPKRGTGGPNGSQTGPTNDPLTNAFNQCMKAHGIQTRYIYQPADRFWLFQEIESGIYVVLSALLLAFTFWWTRSRIIGNQR